MTESEKLQRIHNALCYNTYMKRILNQKEPISDYQLEVLQSYVSEACLCLEPLDKN